MRLLVFGKIGQVATALAARAPDGIYLDQDAADLLDPAACARAVAGAAADAVINAAAYTAVDKAEAEPEIADTINGAAPAAMAEAAAAKGVPFLHISTDYVFAGEGDRPYPPDAPTAPRSAYGRSKALGEAGVRAAGGAHAILRTSWVFSPGGANFLNTMRRLGGERESLSIVDDQIGGPTEAGDIADALLTMARAMLDGAPGGTYNFAGAPDVSWADFAAEIFAQAGLDCRVERIPSADYPTAAERPLNSRLDCTTITRDFGIVRPDWRRSVTRALQGTV